MPITALPPNTVRAIGSSQALSDSASVVKELIDNAIDGQATKISIELSANTLDDIRVKDNGDGIAPDDRAIICTRYCTSKIRDFHDLENIGGRSLGFRGEALASAAEMSGSLTITTRIESEGTAVELKIDRKGQISGESRTSHPVGTTVKVEKYLQNLPVRRQAVEKTAVKMLTKIKRLLQAYALARPYLRLSLKILKAKDRKGDWMYPKSGALSASRLKASYYAATDIFGRKLMSQCEFTCSSWSSTGDQIDEAISEKIGPSASRDRLYTLEAITAKRDCDGSVLSNVGQYISVDSRPVSCTRGTLKQIISSYKSHLRSAAPNENNAKISEPFLCLSIACPPGSYDANVEPAKDDVLFANSELLLGIVERLFSNIYGEVQPTPSKPSTKNVPALKPHGIEIMLARKEAPVDSAPASVSPAVGSTIPLPRSASQSFNLAQPRSTPLKISALSSSPAVPPVENRVKAPSGPLPSYDSSTTTSTEKISLEPSDEAVPVEGKPCWKGSMYAEDEELEAQLETHLQARARSPVDLDLDGDEHLRDVNVSNPWTFAKLNAAMHPSGRNKQLHTPARQIGDAGHSTDPSSDDLPQQVDPLLLNKPLPRVHPARSSPEAAYPTPSPFPFPQKARGKRKADDAGADALLRAAPSNKERQKPGALDTWLQDSVGGYEELEDLPTAPQEHQGPPDLPYSRDFVSARSLPPGGTPLSEIADASQRPRRKPVPRKQQQNNIDRPFIPPVRDPNRVWFDIEEDPLHNRPRKPRPNNGNQGTAGVPTLNLRDDEIEDDESVVPTSTERSLPRMHPDLAITLDYEARKQKASEAHRKVLREQAAAAAAAKFASKAQTDAPNPLHPQHTTSSPHKNRQAKAIAALHTPHIPPPTTPSPPSAAEETPALDPSDPRAYLLRLHQQQQGDQASEPLRGKSRRQKTAMLPFESVTEENYVGDLTLMVEDVNVGDVEEDMEESRAWDRYVRSGEQVAAFGEVGVGEIKRWEGKIRDLVREAYAVEGAEGEERAIVDVDLSELLRAHAARYA